MRKVAHLAAAAVVVVLDALGDGLDLALLAVRAAKLQAAQLKRHEAVAQLDHVDETVEIVGGQEKAVALLDGAPAAEGQIAVEAVLKRAGQLLVEDGVEVVVVGAEIALEVQRHARVRVVDPGRIFQVDQSLMMELIFLYS